MVWLVSAVLGELRDDGVSFVPISFSRQPAPDCDSDEFDEEVSARWERADEAARRCFDRRSAELVAGASAGMEAVFAQRERGLDASIAALQVIAKELKAGLRDLERIFNR